MITSLLHTIQQNFVVFGFIIVLNCVLIQSDHIVHSHSILKEQFNSSCYNGTWWIYHYFGECVSNLTQLFAFIFGFLSIFCWFFAQIPQLIKNCRSGKADAALSCLFLFQWLGGDLTNLIGAFLTQQLPTQIATAIYFVFMDVLLLSQYLFYLIKNKRSRSFQPLETSKDIYIIIIPCIFTSFLFSTSFIFMLYPSDIAQTITFNGRILLSFSDNQPNQVVDINNWKDIIGYVFGCISALLYLGSRLPQILKNFKRRSVDGLSLPMFIMAVFGNLTYGLGIFLYSIDKVFLLRKLPWLLGSIGTLCFDFTIFLQFLCFSKLGNLTICRKIPKQNPAKMESTPTDSNYPPLIDKSVNCYQTIQ